MNLTENTYGGIYGGISKRARPPALSAKVVGVLLEVCDRNDHSTYNHRCGTLALMIELCIGPPTIIVAGPSRS